MIQQAMCPTHGRPGTATARQGLRCLITVASLTTAALLAAACNGEIYVRDGVTDGDTFYLAERALTDTDPVLQSWVSYSLSRSACQLQIGGENPARESSFECELGARAELVESWSGQRAGQPYVADGYLDELARVEDAGFLPEYVADNFRRRGWQLPADLDARAYRDWRQMHLPRHRPMTRLIGSWNYRRNVDTAAR
jgi:hypothetical protein